jgi:di/tricarboxylate transporter
VTQDQVLVLVTLLATLAMFLWGRWRHDMVAAGALLTCVALGLVPVTEAFSGFGHPAVVTVACVLVLSQGLQNSGLVDTVARRVLPTSAGPTLTIAALTLLGAALSAFMNNVGALALLMPVALQVAIRHEMSPARVLMPLAFGSILGGMTTLIGTPPNLIVAGFRGAAGGPTFRMFDFTPVGAAVASAGVAFVALAGWRLVPARRGAGAEGFEAGAYVTEARVPDGSKAAGMALRDIEAALEEADAQAVGLVRHDIRVTAPSPGDVVRAGDILVLQAEGKALATALSTLGLTLAEAKRVERPKSGEDASGEEGDGADAPGAEPEKAGKAEKPPARSNDVVLMELVVLPGAALTGRSPSEILLRTRHGLNLLAISRQGRRAITRLRTMTFRAGDVLLVQGPPDAISDFAATWGCVPLAERPLRIPDTRQAITALAILALAIAGAAFGLVPASISFAAGVLASMALRTVPPRAVYAAIDWPVIVLLAALIPVAGAMERTGAADLIARVLLGTVAQGHVVVALAVILIVTMMLSDAMNNAATAAVMCPIAIGAATGLGVSADPFLMAVAVGASCAFLTPIGHQNNTLILGPGGLEFGDYWRLGLPLEILILAIGVPMLLLVWPP